MRRGLAAAIAVWIVPALVSCAASDDSVPDAGDAGDGTDGGETAEVSAPVPPEAPAPPILGPCPDGWEQVPADGDDPATCDPWPGTSPVTLTPCPAGWREIAPDAEQVPATCDPWPAGGAVDCVGDEAHFPGEAGCVRVGTACPAGDWPEGIPSDATVLYVRAGEPAGGDGTRGAPLGSLVEAAGRSASGTVIALARGTYDEAVTLPEGVALWGACVAETLLAPTTPPTEIPWAVVTAGGSGTTVRNLRIGGERDGLWVTGGRSMHVEDVVVDGALRIGILVTEGAELTGGNVVVRDTRRNAEGYFGRGLAVEGGARAELTRVAFERNVELGISLIGVGSSVVLSDAAVRDTLARSDDQLGRGIQVQQGGALELRRSAVERNLEAGILATDAGTTVVLTEVVSRDNLPRATDDLSGRGLQAQTGAQATASRSLFSGNHDVGVFVSGDGSLVELLDVVVRDTHSEAREGEYGWGLGAMDRSTARVRRGVFVNNAEAGVVATIGGAVVDLEDVVVRDTRGREADGAFGTGLEIQREATGIVSRALLAGNRYAGFQAVHAGSSATLADVVIRDTQAQDSDSRAGRGIDITEAASVEAARVLVEGNHEVGVAVTAAGSFLRLSDAVVRDTHELADGSFGDGVVVGEGAAAEIDRLAALRNRRMGVVLDGTGSAATLTDVAVRGTLPQATDGTFGRGLGIQEGASCDGVRVALERNHEAGLFAIGDGSTAVLADLAVRDTRSTPGGGLAGRGLCAQYGAAVAAERVDVSGNREVGVLALGDGTSVALADVTVLDTLERDCAAGACPGRGAGIAAGTYAGAALELERFVLGRSALCGAQIARGRDADGTPFDAAGDLLLRDGEVSHNPVGVNVQAEDFDPARLTDRVVYIDNDRDLDGAALPVPGAI